jgi:hypothetical protein
MDYWLATEKEVNLFIRSHPYKAVFVHLSMPDV